MKRKAAIGFLIGLFLLACMVSLSCGQESTIKRPANIIEIEPPGYDATGTWNYSQTVWWSDCTVPFYPSTGTATIVQSGNDFTIEIIMDGALAKNFDGAIYADHYHAFDLEEIVGGFTSAHVFDFKLDSSAVANGYTNGVVPDGSRATCTFSGNFQLTKQGLCTPSETLMCLQNGRFSVNLTWEDEHGNTGDGHAIPSTDDSGLFWFFSESNMELLIKVLNGCGINNRYWVFFAATTDQKFTVRVTDLETDEQVEYTNPLKHSADAVTDTDAFATCP